MEPLGQHDKHRTVHTSYTHKCVSHRPFLTHYGTWTTPTHSMEYGPLLPPVWNTDHSYPQYEISTPNLGVEYGPLPTPSKKYRSLLIASIEYGPLLTPVWNMHCS